MLTRSAFFLYILSCLGFLFFVAMLQITTQYLSGRTDVGFLLTKQDVLHLSLWRYAFYIHISCSLPVLLLGFLQVSEFVRARYKSAHRVMGKIYVGAILLFSAP